MEIIPKLWSSWFILLILHFFVLILELKNYEVYTKKENL